MGAIEKRPLRGIVVVVDSVDVVDAVVDAAAVARWGTGRMRHSFSSDVKSGWSAGARSGGEGIQKKASFKY